MFSQRTSESQRGGVVLTPEMNIRLRPKLLALKAGARIVANTFAIGDWNPDQSFTTSDNCEVLLRPSLGRAGESRRSVEIASRRACY